MRPPVYRLIPDMVSHDTVKALEYLLAEAKKGRIVGVVFAAMFKQRYFIVNSTDEFRRNPTFARGVVAAIDDEHRRMLNQ